MTDAHDWLGRVGDVWAQEWQRTDRGFAGIAHHLDAAIAGVAPAGPFAALDIGCGAGATSLALAQTRCDARIVGIDLSAGLVEVARDRARAMPFGVPRPAFVIDDAAAAAVAHGPFDLLMSRHGVMFFSDPVPAFAALHRAARPGAPLIFSCFRDRALNPWAGTAGEVVAGRALPPVTDAPGPFAFRDERRVAAILAAAGWRDATARALDCPYRVGGGADPIADALGFFARIGVTAGLLAALDPPALAAARERLTVFAKRHRDGDAVALPAAIWLWSAYA